jgi:hypothetical protein
MEKSITSSEATPPLAYRSGVAARMAGLPVETLRVWERRYGLSDTPRSEHGQRLYSAEQVRRLTLLKQLVDQGHAIGMLSGLSMERLAAMSMARANGPLTPAGPVRVAVVGDNLLRRIAADRREGNAFDVQSGCARLDQAAQLVGQGQAEVLLVEVSELDHGAVPRIFAIRQQLEVRAVVVLYRFCASATIRELRELGCLVSRVPAELGELLMLCRTAIGGSAGPRAVPARVAVPPAPPGIKPARFDETQLAAFAAASSALQCECPRQLAEVLMMLGSFERYSAQCANRNLADAVVHLELEIAAAQARTILEHALENLALAEGIALPTGATPGVSSPIATRAPP